MSHTASTPPAVPPDAVHRALAGRSELGLLDVRPEGQYAQGHPLFAANLPLGRLERQAYERIPRRSVPLVVYGDGDEDAAYAAGRLRELGYCDVAVLAGGLSRWAAEGREVFRDVNVPSKAFGELVQDRAGTPAIGAADLSAALASTSEVAVLDARRFDEYQQMSIPTATSVPGAGLVSAAPELAPDPATMIVVNCAGRTRSIIGAQSLINAGVANPVAALRNGTIGWTLAGLQLEHGQDRRAPAALRPGTASGARGRALYFAARTGVRHITPRRLAGLHVAGQRTIYQFDVRSPEEYDAGHLPGFRPAPGGQLVQETDWFAPVRGALIVLADDPAGQAAMTASWLAQMSWEVVLLRAATGGGVVERGAGGPSLPPAPGGPVIAPADVEAGLRAGGIAVVDVDTSARYLAGHVPGAAWALRADLALGSRPALPAGPARLALTSADGFLAAFAAADLRDRLGLDAAVLAGGTAGWAGSGRPLQAGPERTLSAAADAYRRPYEGTGVDAATMQAYLDWEYGLVAQLDRDASHGFWVLGDRGARPDSRPPRRRP